MPDTGEINRHSFDNVIKHFSRDLNEIKDMLSNEQNMTEDFAYAYNSLRAYPIIRVRYGNESKLICPLPTLFLWRFTRGLYYELYHEPYFGNHFGKALENLAGQVINAALSNENVGLSSLPESEYYVDGNNRKDTVDWIVHDSTHALFIECKTKRVIIPATTALSDTASLIAELGKMAESIVQTYKTIRDYQNNYYPTFPYKPNMKIYPIVVTLENWFLFGGKVLEELDLLVRSQLESHGLALSVLEIMPYSICSIEELEDVMLIIRLNGIGEFIEGKLLVPEKKKWDFRAYIQTDYKSVIDKEYIFKQDYMRLFQSFKDSVMNN